MLTKPPHYLYKRVGKLILIILALVLMSTGFLSRSGADVAVAAPGFIDAKMDPTLVDALANAGDNELFEVIIVFNDLSIAPEVSNLATDYLQMDALPMAGAIMTKQNIEKVAGYTQIYSVTLNQDLHYTLAESISYIKADQVWNNYNQRGGNPDVTVAVIDSGIDGLHPDLPFGDKVIQNVKVTALGVNVEDVPTTDNTSGHGTHVAGIIGGTGAFSNGHYTGVAPEVGLIGLGAGEGINILTAVQSYDWVLQNHAEYNIRVVNNSWGTSGGDLNVRNPITIATYEAYQQGILSVFAAGNDGGYDIMNPYSIAPWVLSVAAGDKSGNLAGFSSRGVDGDYYKHPDITAPGVDIYSARCSCVGVTATDPLNPVDPAWTPYYASLDGTSMATPHVAGAAALLLSENPNLSPDQVMELLINSTTPMPDYELFEVGYGYMDVLAAFEDSLTVAGNLDAFLAGDQHHGMEEVLFVDENELQFSSVSYSGYSAAGVTTMPANEYPVTVDEFTVYVNAHVSWDPQEEDAFDLELVDENGNVVASSGNAAGEPEDILFLADGPGNYTLRVVPFAAVNAQYTAEITTAFTEDEYSGPPDLEPAFDYYMNITNLYKTAGVIGLAADYFKGGDSGFLIFTFSPSDGTSGAGHADELTAIYTDSQGNVFVDDNIRDRGEDNEYQSSFAIDNDWTLAPGPITVHFTYDGEGTARPPQPHTFFYNHLDVTLDTNATNYYPGDPIHFDGTVSQFNTVGTADVEVNPVDALVAISLRDREGNVLANDVVQADLQGNFSGTLDSPDSTRGTVELVAEATYQDPTVLTGPASNYGTNDVSLIFPGNLVPETELTVSSSTGRKNKFYIHMHATASDPDGLSDITKIEVLITDADGRRIRRFKLNHFSPFGDEYLFTRSQKVSGQGPWTVTITVTDSAGNTATASEIVSNSD